MLSLIRPALLSLAALSLLCGLLYPLLTYALAQSLFPAQANGSLLQRDGKIAGSSLIGQPFAGPGYFWSRPSSTGPMPYNGLASGGSNLGPSNPALREAAQARLQALQASGAQGLPPQDMLSASASGLDPHISPAAAQYQIPRVAHARGMTQAQLEALVQAHTALPQVQLFGAPRVNVLALNLALDAAARGPAPHPKN